jgi:hypothetical protein
MRSLAINLKLTILVGIVGLVVLPMGMASEGDSNEVTIKVLLTLPDGPVANVAMRLQCTDRALVAETDANGSATFRFAPSPTDHELRITFEDGSVTGWSDAYSRLKPVRDLLSRYYFPSSDRECWRLTIELQPETREYSVELRFEPAVTISGVIVLDEKPYKRGASLVGARWSNGGLATPDENGRFECRAVPRGSDNELFVNTFPLVTGFPVSHDQTAKDVFVGELHVPDVEQEPAGYVELFIKNLTGEMRDISGRRLDGGATLISSDGKRILSYFYGEGGRMYTRYGSKSPLRIPVGKYVAVPGSFSARDIQVGLRDALVNGVELEGVELPVLTVNKDETTRFEFDAPTTLDAIKKFLKQQDDVQDRLNPSSQPAVSPN